MSLMANLFVGQSGLQTSQNALNTTAHNMSNVDTTGYTRQQVMQSDMFYNTVSRDPGIISYKQIGQGVVYSKVRQVRDYFLDQAYRRESGRSAYYSTSYETISQVQTLLGEMHGATFNNSMENIQRAIDELAKTPADSVVQGLVIQRAAAFLESAQGVYQGMCDYQDNLNMQIANDVDTINDYAKKIFSLNEQIVKVEAGGKETANDLRDARNQLLDELGAMGRIGYREDNFGNVIVQFESHDLVSRNMVYEIDVEQDNITGFYTPFWKMDAGCTTDSEGRKHYNTEGAEVFNLKQTISTAANTDIGSVKAKLLARGDRRANYTDLEDKTAYNKEIAPSLIMNMQAEFDRLIHAVTTKINGILADAADPSTGYLCEKVMVEGKETWKPIQLFQKKATDGYTYETDDTGKNGEWVYSEENFSERETLYTTTNMLINPALLKEPTKLNFRRPDGKEDYETAAKLAEAFQTDELSLNPNISTKTSFSEFYDDLVSQVAGTGNVLYSITQSQADTVEATCYAREQIMGVSSDEEMTNMVKFQNAYNAASRYINVVNEMLAHLLNSLAG